MTPYTGHLAHWYESEILPVFAEVRRLQLGLPKRLRAGVVVGVSPTDRFVIEAWWRAAGPTPLPSPPGRPPGAFLCVDGAWLAEDPTLARGQVRLLAWAADAA
jgi:hypothetical protein